MDNAVGRAWTYLVAAGLVIFLVSACSRGGTDTPPDTASPTVPTDVQATTLSPDVIVLTWSPSSDNVGVAKYEIYVGGVPVYSMESTTTVFEYTGLMPSTEYCCTVRAIDAAGNESALSDPPACAVTAAVPDTIPPAAPTGLIETSSQSKVHLSWVASADASGYKVYRDGVIISAVPTASFLDAGLNASTRYCYAVTAIDAAGNESAQSDSACISTLALDSTIPTVISTSPSSNADDVQIDPFEATATFSEAMNMLSVTGPNSFTLTNTTGPVIGVLDYIAATDTIRFTPLNPLAPGEVYTATISKNVQDIAGGNFMGTDYIWSFTTTTTPIVTLPTVSSTAPSNGELNVATINVVIKTVFSEVMDPNTVLALSNFACFDTTSIPNVSVPGLVNKDFNTQTTFVFTPSAVLARGTIYECRISKNVTDQSGHGMAANYTWHFVTTP